MHLQNHLTMIEQQPKKAGINQHHRPYKNKLCILRILVLISATIRPILHAYIFIRHDNEIIA